MPKADSKNQLKISKDEHGHKSMERIEAEIAQSTVVNSRVHEATHLRPEQANLV